MIVQQREWSRMADDLQQNARVWPAACVSSSGAITAGADRSTYPQAFLVDLPRRAIAEALVLALLIVEAKPGADAGLGLGDCCIGVEIDFLVFEAAPQSLDEDVVHAAALAVHTDHHPVPLQC